MSGDTTLAVRELALPSYVTRRLPLPDSDAPWGRRMTDPAGVAAVLKALPIRNVPLADLAVECFGVLVLNTRHAIRGFSVVSIGLVDASLAHPREVFRPAIVEMGAAVVLFHNHPSGDPEPSPDDISLTTRMVSAGALLGIPVLDHVIVAGDRYHSFRESGRL